jgi:hypothetical protein
MGIEIIIAALLIVFGFFILYRLDRGISDKEVLLIIILGFLSIASGAWIIIRGIGLWTIIKKLIGLCLLGIGGFLTISFPDVTDYQPEGFGLTGIFIGLVMLVLGIYLILF